MNDNPVTRPLSDLYKDSDVNALSRFGARCQTFTREDIALWYGTEMPHAPDRRAVGKRYLVDTHDGVPGAGEYTNRGEEHLALAIFNEHRPPNPGLLLPNEEVLRILDYQLPLKAKQRDIGVGKVDLFAFTSSGRACVIELKASYGRDTPLKALLEGLAFAAIVQANMASIRQEVQDRYHLEITSDIPEVTVMAPEETYWSRLRDNPAAGDWERSLRDLAARVQDSVGVSVSFVSLGNASFTYGLGGTRPLLDSTLTCQWALREST